MLYISKPAIEMKEKYNFEMEGDFPSQSVYKIIICDAGIMEIIGPSAYSSPGKKSRLLKDKLTSQVRF